MSQQSSSATLAVEASARLSTQDMWAMYVQGVIDATGLPGSHLILTGTAVPADLATTSVAVTPDPLVPQALAQIYSLGDQMLEPTGTYTLTGQSFFDDYATYIDNLEPQDANPTPSQQAAINVAKRSLATATGQNKTDQIAAFAAYNAEISMFQGKWTNFQDYLNGTSWGGTLNADQNSVDGANAKLSALYTQTYGQDYVAINAAKTVVDQVRAGLTSSSVNSPAQMQITTDAGSRVVPNYSPSSLATFSSWVDMAATGPANNQKPEVSISINQSAAKYDFSKSTYFSQSSWSSDDFFFSVSGSSTQQRTQVDVDSSSSSFGVDITFQAVTSVTITPGPWYDPSLLYSYANASGAVVPNALIIGMMPTVTVRFDEASYNTAFSAYSSSSSFGVGIFCFGGGNSSSSSNTSFQGTWDAQSFTLTIKDISTQPKIIALQVWEPKSSS